MREQWLCLLNRHSQNDLRRSAGLLIDNDEHGWDDDGVFNFESFTDNEE